MFKNQKIISFRKISITSKAFAMAIDLKTNSTIIYHFLADFDKSALVLV
jgi:hypothetical protein